MGSPRPYLRRDWAANQVAGRRRRSASPVGVAEGYGLPPPSSAASELRYVRQLSALPEEIGALTLLKSLKLSQNVLSLLPARHA
jgi:hypothetical protein